MEEQVKIRDVLATLEAWAPKALQEHYDNSGLICGDKEQPLGNVLVSLDCTVAVVEEAIDRGANLIVSHHPIVFKGLKSLTGKTYVERTVIKAIKHNIALYAIHTNLDNVTTGVNHIIGEKLGLQNRRILQPKDGHLKKLIFFTPKKDSEAVLEAIFQAGGGHIGEYSDCAYRLEGLGSFKPGEGTNPAIGESGGDKEFVQETRAELIVPEWQLAHVLEALFQAHPYEEVAYDIYPLTNTQDNVGSGMVGELEEAMDEKAFLRRLKDNFHVPCIRHTEMQGRKIRKVAYCGGSGFFLLSQAKAAGADIYFTGDIKYHEFFDGENELLLCDIGHFESEQFTIDGIKSYISKNFPNFEVYKTNTRTNPVHYFI